jgi:predicted transcriptional regulator
VMGPPRAMSARRSGLRRDGGPGRLGFDDRWELRPRPGVTSMQERRLFRRLGDPARTGAERLLGDLESEVMEVVWAQGRASVRLVLEALNARRPTPVAYTTVLTVMQRLAEKGILDRHRAGNTDHYAARQSRDAFFAESSGRIVRALVEDFGDIAIAQFLAEIDRLDPERLQRLRALAESEARDDEA